MQFVDFSPPTNPSLDQQRDALQKGLGRVVQWARTGVLDIGPLLNACLHDQRFDQQCEDNRGEWLWKIITKTGAAQLLRDSLLGALRAADDEREAYQLCELALHFARSGDDAFRTQLYEFVRRRQFTDSPGITDPESQRQGYIQRMQAITVSDVFHAVGTEDKCYWLRGWGTHAEQPALDAVLERLWVEQDPAVIVKLLRAWSNRPLPTFDSRLIELHQSQRSRCSPLIAEEKGLTEDAATEVVQTSRISVQPKTGATRFVFDLGCVLHCRRFARDDDAELWMLYKPSGYVLSVDGNGNVAHQRGNVVKKRIHSVRDGSCKESR